MGSKTTVKPMDSSPTINNRNMARPRRMVSSRSLLNNKLMALLHMLLLSISLRNLMASHRMANNNNTSKATLNKALHKANKTSSSVL